MGGLFVINSPSPTRATPAILSPMGEPAKISVGCWVRTVHNNPSFDNYRGRVIAKGSLGSWHVRIEDKGRLPNYHEPGEGTVEFSVNFLVVIDPPSEFERNLRDYIRSEIGG